MKNHARPSVIDIWIPGGQYWKHSLKHVPFAVSESELGVDPKYAKLGRDVNKLGMECMQ